MGILRAKPRKTASGRYEITIMVAGVRKKSTHDTYNQALQWAIDKQKELERGESLINNKTLADALLRYAAEETPKKQGARWENVRIKKFLKLDLARMMIADIRPHHIERWRDESLKTLKPDSVIREMSVMGPVFNAAIYWHWIKESPMTKVKKPKPSPHRQRRWWPEDVAAVLDALNWNEEKAIDNNSQAAAWAFLFALETAMRQGEIFGLKWRNVHTNKKYVHIEKTKNGDNRDVPLSARAIELINLLPRKGEKMLSNNQAATAQRFRAAIKLAELNDITFHDARHEACTRLAEKLTMLELAKMIGHRDPRNLMIYYNPTASELADKL